MRLQFDGYTSVWLIGNFAAQGLWLFFACALWPDSGLEHCAPDGAESITFVFIVLPITCFVLLLWVVATFAAILGLARNYNVSHLIAVIFTTLFWVVCVTYDYHRTFRIVTSECPY